MSLRFNSQERLDMIRSFLIRMFILLKKVGYLL